MTKTTIDSDPNSTINSCDRQIHQLIIDISEEPDNSPKQVLLLSKLLQLLTQQHFSYYSQKAEIDKESLNKALIELCGISLRDGKKTNAKNIRNFTTQFIKRYHRDLTHADSQIVVQGLVNWVKTIIRRRKLDLLRQPKNQPISLDATFNSDEDGNSYLDQLADPTLSGLEAMMNNEEEAEEFAANQQRYLELQERLKTLSTCYPKGYPQANCYELIKRRFLREPKQRWREIAEELGIRQGTVTAHWDRRCKPLLRELGIEQNFSE